jgi:DHA1 family tetracycline resistance protein-like MFS transporter
VSEPRRLAVLYFQVFVDQLGFGIVLPFLPVYGRDLGASGFEVGLLLAVYSLGNMLVSTPWGRLSDRIGRRPVLVASACGAAAGFVVCGSANALWIVFLGRGILGAFGVGMQTAQAWVADVTPPESRGRTLATLGAAGGLGFVLGPAIGGIGLLVGGMRVGFFVAAAFSAANAVFAATLLPRVSPVPRADRGVRAEGWRLILPILAITAVLVYAFSNIEATFAMFTRDELAFHDADNNWLFAVMGVVAATTQALATPRLAARLDEPRRVALGLALIATGSALVPQATSLWTLIPIVAVMASGLAVTSPSIAAWVSCRAPADRQGELLGLSQAVGGFARVAGPGIGGVLYDHAGHPTPFRVGGILLALAAAGAFRAKSQGVRSG